MKIPKQAKRVFKGVIFNVYQWQQKMFDGSYATFEAIKRPSTVIIMPLIGNKICLADEEQPIKGRYYCLLGGRVDKKEKPIETAKRELLEESGLASNDWRLLKIYEPGLRMEWKVYLYLAKNCQKVTNQKLDAGEKIKVKKVTFNQFAKIVDSDKFRGKEFANDLFRIKQDKKKLAEFKKKIFGNAQ